MMRIKNWFVPIAALLVLAGLQFFQNQEAVAPSDRDTATGLKQLMDAYDSKQSKVWVEVAGVVDKLLPDDNKGSRHQRFILKFANQHTVLVAHNIDLASYVPLSRGDKVVIRGRYEFNPRGGVLHWTHHDPKGHIRGGWIEFAGKQYQ